MAFPSLDPAFNPWKRLLVGFAEELTLDGSGRLLLSPELRSFAGIGRQVMLVGQGSHFELWDVELWNEMLQKAITQAASSPPPGTENFSL